MAGSAVWLDVLPSMAKFGSNMAKQATTAARTAGVAAGKQFSAGMTAGSSTSAAKALVTELETASKRVARVVQTEKTAIAKARADEAAAAKGVQAAEARLAAARTTTTTNAAQALVRAEQAVAAAQARQESSVLGVQGAEARLAAARTGTGKAAAAQALKAEQSLKLALGQQQVSAHGLQAAESALADARKLGTAESASVLQAEQQLTTARGRQQVSALKVTAVEDQLRAAFNEQKTVTGQLAAAQAKASREATVMGSRFTKLAQAGAPLSAGLGKVAAGAKNVATTALSTLKPLASMAAGFGAIIGVSSIIKLGNEYTSTMNTLQAVTDATGSQMTALSKKSKALGADLTLPATSAKDSAAIMLELAKAGFSVDESMQAAKGSIQLAAAAQIDGAAAAEIQSNTMNQFGLRATSATRVADILANTANAASGDITDIAYSMKYVGSQSNAMGVSLRSTAAALGVLANMGIKGEQAGTSLRSMMAKLAAPTKQGMIALDDMGVTAFDASGKFVGLRKIVEQLSKAQKRLSQEDFAWDLKKAFGTENLSAVNNLAKAGVSGARGYDAMFKAVGRSGGAAKVAAANMKGFGGALDKLESQLQDVALTIYNTVTPALTSGTTGIASWLSSTQSNLEDFLQTAGGLGKLAFTGQVTPAVGGIDPKVVAGIQTARGIIVGAFRDIWAFTTQSLIPSLKNIAIAVAPIAAVVGGVFLLAFRAAAAVLRVVGPLLVGVTGFLARHKIILGLVATAVGVLVTAYWSMQVIPGIIGGVSVALLAAKRVQEGFALASYGAAAATQAQTLAGKAGVAAFALYNASLRVGAALVFGYKVATLGWTKAVAAQKAGTLVATGAQWAFNSALLANPIGLIVIAIVAAVAALAALVAGVVWAYKNLGWFKTAVDAVWTAIQVGAKAVAAAAVWLWQNVFVPAWKGIAAAAQWAWNTVLKPTFDGIMVIVRGVAAVFTWWWQNITMPVFHGIAAVAGWMWNTVSAIFDLAIAMIKFALAPVFNLLAATAKLAWAGITAAVQWAWGILSTTFKIAVGFIRGTLGLAFSWLYTSVVKPVFAWISQAVQIGWITMRIVFAAIASFLRTTLGPVFTWLWKSVIAPAWLGIKIAVQVVWNWLKPVFDKIAYVAKNTIPAAFDVMKNGISKAWDAVKTAAKAPIKFVVNTVVNDALIGNFNKVATVFGTKKITPISLPKGFAGGGVIPGYQAAKRDDVLTPMRRGEGVLVPEVVRGLGPSTIHALNAAGNSGGVQAVRRAAGYAKGGIVGAVTSGWDWVKGTAGKAWDWGKNAAETAANVISDPMGTLGKLVKSVISQVPGAGRMVDMASGMASKTLTAAVDAIKKIGDSGAGAGTGKNGDLPTSALMKVTGFAPGSGVGAMGGYLRIAAARAWQAMQQASGNTLGLTEGYRDLANQNKRWAMYKAGGNLAAVPGTSVHGLGNAADIGAGQAWARANGAKYGWVNTGLGFSQREPWHFEFKGGKTTSGAGMALGGIVNGLTPTLYDSGGVLPRGLSLVQNNLQEPEIALPIRRLESIVAGSDTRRGGDTHWHITEAKDTDGLVKEVTRRQNLGLV